MRRHLIDFRSELPGARGAGYDQRTGEVVLLVTPADAPRLGADAIRARAEQISGVPVRVVVNQLIESNMSVDGGGLVEGVNTPDQPPRPLHDRIRRHQWRDQRDHDRGALPRPADLYRSRRQQQRDAADDRLVGPAAIATCRSTAAPIHRDPFFYANRGAGIAARGRDVAERGEHPRRRLRLPLWRKLGLQLRDRRADRLCAARARCAAVPARRPG